MDTNKLVLKDEIPPLREFSRIRSLIGWGGTEDDVMQRGLENSLFSVCAYVDNQFVGCVRVVGDGYMKFYVEELMVDPDYQKNGIGTSLMQRIMDWFYSVAFNGSYLGLMSNRNLDFFYERFGFQKRPVDMPGMQQIYRTNKRSESAISEI